MTTLEQQRKEWATSFEDVENEVLTLFATRETWRMLRAVMVAGGTRNRGFIVGYLDRTYVAAVCSAIRRQLDTDQQSNSLSRSLLRVKEQPNLIDRAYFVRLHHQAHEPDPFFDADAAFNRFALVGSDVVDPEMISQALLSLEAAAAPVKVYADRVIAHRDRKSANLAFGQIDAALAELEKVVKQFWELAHPGSMLHSASPTLDLSFLQIFRTPLIDDTFRLPLPL